MSPARQSSVILSFFDETVWNLTSSSKFRLDLRRLTGFFPFFFLFSLTEYNYIEKKTFFSGKSWCTYVVYPCIYLCELLAKYSLYLLLSAAIGLIFKASFMAWVFLPFLSRIWMHGVRKEWGRISLPVNLVHASTIVPFKNSSLISYKLRGSLTMVQFPERLPPTLYFRGKRLIAWATVLSRNVWSRKLNGVHCRLQIRYQENRCRWKGQQCPRETIYSTLWLGNKFMQERIYAVIKSSMLVIQSASPSNQVAS